MNYNRNNSRDRWDGTRQGGDRQLGWMDGWMDGWIDDTTYVNSKFKRLSEAVTGYFT